MDVDEWVVKLDQAEVGRRTQQISVNVLSAMLESALKDGLRPDNPCAGMKRPTAEPDEPMFLTPAEGLRLLEKMDDPGLASVMLFCGLRWSEAAALKGDAIDWFQGQVIVRRARTRPGSGSLGSPRRPAAPSPCTTSCGTTWRPGSRAGTGTTSCSPPRRVGRGTTRTGAAGCGYPRWRRRSCPG